MTIAQVQTNAMRLVTNIMLMISARFDLAMALVVRILSITVYISSRFMLFFRRKACFLQDSGGKRR